MHFSFKVKKKSAYDKGVIVIGKILSGFLSCGDDVIVAVGKNEYKAQIDSIIDKPNGGLVQRCSSGNNVSLYLAGIDEHIVKPGVTVVKNIDSKIFVSKYSKKSGAKKSAKREEEQNKVGTGDVVQKKTSNLKSKKYDYSSVEKNFIQDISLCLKNNGRIAPTELYVLDKLRIAYNIPEERGQQLILATIKKYDAKKNEMIYRDAVSACLLDCGYLTITESCLLEKLRVALNIPENKAYLIEKDSDWDI